MGWENNKTSIGFLGATAVCGVGRVIVNSSQGRIDMFHLISQCSAQVRSLSVQFSSDQGRAGPISFI